ncbi:MAG: periplasmic heavy metal sensor [Paracoccaceae bacterium]|nr:periplasmic heavy metal sensor [Paracoccaceae bacterium]
MTFPTDPQTPQPAARAPLRGWIKGLLFVSLALNVAVAGLAIGAVLRHGDMSDHRRSKADQFGGPYTSALTREDRRAIWREMRSLHREGRPSRAEIRAEFEAVVAALRAEPYDAAQVRAIVGRQFEAGMARQHMGQALLLDRIDGMSAAERAAFADRLDERLASWREGRTRARDGSTD